MKAVIHDSYSIFRFVHSPVSGSHYVRFLSAGLGQTTKHPVVSANYTVQTPSPGLSPGLFGVECGVRVAGIQGAGIVDSIPFSPHPSHVSLFFLWTAYPPPPPLS